MSRALTGVQPSGELHIGNYIGSIRPILQLQDEHEVFCFIADYHALTSMKDPAALYRSTLHITATFLALGLDPQKHLLFRQSAVPEVAELAWILSCNLSSGALDRGHAVKAAKDGNRMISAGTVFYPVLMAADILLYDADVVPVGPDQNQHVEICRDLAGSVNHKYGEDTLVVPTCMSQKSSLVMGVDGRKMSKSYGNGIDLWLPEKKLRKTINKIVTDSKGVEEPKDPETCTVFAMYRLFASEAEQRVLAKRYREGPMGYGEAKLALFEAVNREIGEARARYNDWMSDESKLIQTLTQGEERARARATKTIERVRSRVGLRKMGGAS